MSHLFSEPTPTLAQALHTLTAKLSAAGVEHAASDARALVCAAAKVSPTRLVTSPDSILTEAQVADLEGWASRRIAREPLTRILGRRGFWTFELDVFRDVLDPRPDSERLIEICLERASAMGLQPRRILDVGCGSGALIAALLIENPDATGVALDLSEAAVAAATANLTALGLAPRCDIRLRDWRLETEGGFDLVVSNPPYIPSDVIDTLDPEVTNHDPRVALDGGRDGLSAYRSLAQMFGRWLKPGGLAAMEIGYDQGEAVMDIMRDAGLAGVSLALDHAGHPRVVTGQRI